MIKFQVSSYVKLSALTFILKEQIKWFYSSLNITAAILIFKKYIKYWMDFVKKEKVYLWWAIFFNMTPCFITEPQTDTGTINTVKLQ